MRAHKSHSGDFPSSLENVAMSVAALAPVCSAADAILLKTDPAANSFEKQNKNVVGNVLKKIAPTGGGGFMGVKGQQSWRTSLPFHPFEEGASNFSRKKAHQVNFRDGNAALG